MEIKMMVHPYSYYDPEYKIPDSYVFPLFYVTSDYRENKFKNTRISKCIDQIYKERNTFEKDLPESIYLRTYYERPDLFQAAIVGLPGTPYEDGIYVFDLKLPNNYPNSPPVVIYHSHGRRLKPSVMDSNGNFRNKNLFDNLNPNKSSILLQVLLYIRHVVLNSNPYCKEPSMDDFYELDSPDLRNEHHLILECTLIPHLYAYQSMVDILDNIPSLFKWLVCRYFIIRGDDICKAFDAILKHHMTYGQFRGLDDLVSGKMTSDQCYALPEEFPKAKVVKLRGNLARVFAENQANALIAMSQFMHSLEDLAGFLEKPFVGKTLL